MKKLVLLAPVCALVLAGCAHDPTVAATVNGQSVPISDISLVTSYLCETATQGQQVVPISQVNEIATTYLIGAKALTDIAARNHVTIPAAPSQDDPLIAKLPSGQQARATDLVNQINTAANFFARNGATSSQQILSGFASVIQSEQKAGRLVGNPAYPTVADQSAGSISKPVSAAAQSASSGQPSTTYLAGLPSGQKCG